MNMSLPNYRSSYAHGEFSYTKYKPDLASVKFNMSLIGLVHGITEGVWDTWGCIGSEKLQINIKEGVMIILEACSTLSSKDICSEHETAIIPKGQIQQKKNQRWFFASFKELCRHIILCRLCENSWTNESTSLTSTWTTTVKSNTFSCRMPFSMSNDFFLTVQQVRKWLVLLKRDYFTYKILRTLMYIMTYN